MVYLSLRDVFNFLKNYNSKNYEMLILWLSQYSYYDQLLFMKFFIPNRFSMKRCKVFKFLHNKCECEKLYSMIFKDSIVYNNVSDTARFLGKCVPTLKKLNDNVHKLDYTFSTKLDNTTKEMKFIIERYLENQIFEKQSLVFENFKNQCQEILKNFDKNVDSLPIRCFEYFTLEGLLPYIDVYEFYILMDSNSYVKLYDFNMFLPEYMKVVKLRNKESLYATSMQESVLLNIYNFYNGAFVVQTDTQMKLTSGCPNLIKRQSLEAIDSTNCVYQPKVSGIRLVICKPMKSRPIIVNKYNIKVYIPVNINGMLNCDNDNAYTGEFMMVLYDRKQKCYLNRTELIKFMLSRSSTCEIRFFLLDLYIWNGVNMLIQNYEDRSKLFKPFISMVKHNNTIFELPRYDNIISIYNEYKLYLTSENVDACNPFVCGVVYRKRNVIFQKKLECINFKDLVQKNIIFGEYDIQIKLFYGSMSETLKCDNQCVILTDRTAFELCINFVGYDFGKDCLKLALFDKNQFSLALEVAIDSSLKHLNSFTKRQIKIDGVLKKYIIIKTGFINGSLKLIEIRPDKSLLDCFVSKSEFNKLFCVLAGEKCRTNLP
ncbi:hypothetical protein PvNV_032 [Penaeus vannamei nudivirus]|nr:hypothetical protein PvSNPV_032 [Penaeus vannamei nucleopolyhedrovirus]